MTNTDKERADFEEWRAELLDLIFHYANGAMLNGKTELKRHIARIERQIDAVPCAGREAERADKAERERDKWARLCEQETARYEAADAGRVAAEKALSDEREACAQIVEKYAPASQDMMSTMIAEVLDAAAATIRARKGGGDE